MESSGLQGGLFSATNLGLEMQLHLQPQQQQQQQNPQNTQNPQNPIQIHARPPQMVSYTHHNETESNYHHHPPTQAQQTVRQNNYLFPSKPKPQSTLSDDDELGFNNKSNSNSHLDDINGDGKKKASPWQRMKWTDSMVRLLIMAVFYIGDEAGAGSEGNDKKKGVVAGGGLLQRKGKWKSVSRAMMEKGFYVSPQQCEDKFNDLNKRYKRVNEILGKGTACRVVENQSLLDTMDLSPKMKEEVKKLLNSKHLFFREMCAYHNSCGHGTGGGGGGVGTADPSQVNHHSQQKCLHSSENVNLQNEGSSSRLIGGSKMMKIGSEEDDGTDDDDEDEDSDDDDMDDEDEDHEGIIERNSRIHHHQKQNGHHHNHHHAQEDEDDNEDKPSRKRFKKGAGTPHGVSLLAQQVTHEVSNVIQDGGKSVFEKKQWLRMRLMQLEEQQVVYKYETFELEKQRLKWVKFSSKKEREMERAKIENERKKLENERMVLILRQKEIELLETQHQQHQQQQQQNSSNKRGDPSSITG